MPKREKFAVTCGTFGVIAAFLMFAAPLEQVWLNIQGKPGPALPMAAMAVNCVFWTLYGLFKHERDWKIAAPNILGVIVDTVGAVTALMY